MQSQQSDRKRQIEPFFDRQTPRFPKEPIKAIRKVLREKEKPPIELVEILIDDAKIHINDVKQQNQIIIGQSPEPSSFPKNHYSPEIVRSFIQISFQQNIANQEAAQNKKQLNTRNYRHPWVTLENIHPTRMNNDNVNNSNGSHQVEAENPTIIVHLDREQGSPCFP